MDKRKQQKIEDLLKKTRVNKAPKDFTSNVMGDLEMLSNEVCLKDTKLTSILKNVPLEEPSPGFIAAVMTKVEAKATFDYSPIISKRAWLFISSTIVAIISYVLSTAAPTGSSSLLAKVSPYFEISRSAVSTTQSALQRFVQNFEVSSLLAMSLLTLTILIYVDYLSKEKGVA
ncbi:MAG: hypothetical protein HKN90_06540 [Flavobacteriaceae bacterium]|nr:hypothetical protein [Flavobacteriaceae bacterium]